jgi:hypothetical protein
MDRVKGFPKCYAYGRAQTIHYIVLELLGESILDFMQRKGTVPY